MSTKKMRSKENARKVHAEGRREAEWNYGFEQFAAKMKSLSSERDILKAFSEFKVAHRVTKAQAIAHKYEAKEKTVEFIKRQLGIIQQLGVSPLLKLYGGTGFLMKAHATLWKASTKKTKGPWSRPTRPTKRQA